MTSSADKMLVERLRAMALLSELETPVSQARNTVLRVGSQSGKGHYTVAKTKRA